MLAWLGRQGPRAIAVSFALSIALPPLGEAIEPWLTESVFVLLCLAFLRIDIESALAHLRRPGWAIAAVAWTTLVVPAVFGLLMLAAGLPGTLPALYTGLMIQGMASPLLAAPALAAIMGLDATLVLLTMIGGSLVLPVTASLMSALFLGGQLELGPVQLGVRLLALLAGAAAVGLLLRRLLGPARIHRHRHTIDGMNIVVLFVFAVVVMKDVAPQTLQRPVQVLLLVALSFAICVALYLVSAVAFTRAGRRSAASIGFMTSQRNMGIIVAAVGGAIPDLAWLYFALSQFPIYVAPYLLRPFTRAAVAENAER